jgi:CubicO group peptidase (beta-lactamase class C family)
MPRSAGPAGGMSATVGDQLTWARFHLGDGTAKDGTRVLPAELLAAMQQPTAEMPGSALGDAVGISWLLKDVQGTQLVSHGGTTNGQYSDFIMVPSRSFAVTCLSNCGPNGSQLNHEVTKWALEHYLGLKEVELVATDRTDEELAEYTGSFETIAAAMEVTAVRGQLEAAISYKPETLRALRESGEDEPEVQPPFRLGMVEGTDQYVITEGPAAGMRGYFSRDAAGRVDGVHLGGRLASRVAARV